MIAVRKSLRIAGWVEIRKHLVGFRSFTQPTKNCLLLLFRYQHRNPRHVVRSNAVYPSQLLNFFPFRLLIFSSSYLHAFGSTLPALSDSNRNQAIDKQVYAGCRQGYHRSEINAADRKEDGDA
jgi:hypothetical protein